MGKVYLVGAGVGSLDLYTLKAMACIKRADCLIYDHIIDDAILDYTRKDCEVIYAGKKASHHTLKQEEINQLLVEKAQVYDCVVRLKGGDVYVFSRGGEEGEYLYKHNVSFEVVPGVSSVTGGLAYAGIPLTHRGLSSGFEVHTVSLKKNERKTLNFKGMLDDDKTYVFLMGMKHLEYIVEGFIEAGKDLDTPIAIISNASLDNQKVLTGTLGTIVALYNENPLPTPGIIVVGQVIKMRKYLNFYESRPLFYKNILITTINDDHYIYNEIKDLGATIDEVMTGTIEYLQPDIPMLNGYLILASKHGVIGFMEAYLKQYKDLRFLSKTRIMCIGNKTNQILKQYGLEADYVPTTSDSDQLNELLDFLIDDYYIYLVQGSLISNIKVYDEIISVYKNVEVPISEEVKHYDYAFFTCASSVERFSKNNQSTIDTFISIGKQTSKAIRKAYGEVRILECNKSSKDEMITLLRRDLTCSTVAED